MISKMNIVSTAVAILLFALPAAADTEKKKPQIECTLDFTLQGWSAFYKTAKGNGTVACNNGERADVALRIRGGGITVGRSRILDGRGQFSNVFGIEEVFGAYAAVEAHAGAIKSHDAIAMTKGPISLALAGTGQGWDLGLAVSHFSIRRR